MGSRARGGGPLPGSKRTKRTFHPSRFQALTVASGTPGARASVGVLEGAARPSTTVTLVGTTLAKRLPDLIAPLHAQPVVAGDSRGGYRGALVPRTGRWPARTTTPTGTTARRRRPPREFGRSLGYNVSEQPSRRKRAAAPLAPAAARASCQGGLLPGRQSYPQPLPWVSGFPAATPLPLGPRHIHDTYQRQTENILEPSRTAIDAGQRPFPARRRRSEKCRNRIPPIDRLMNAPSAGCCSRSPSHAGPRHNDAVRHRRGTAKPRHNWRAVRAARSQAGMRPGMLGPSIPQIPHLL